MRRSLSSSQCLVPGPAPPLVLASTIPAGTSWLAPAITSCSTTYFILNLLCSLPYTSSNPHVGPGTQIHTACSWKMSAMVPILSYGAITLKRVELVQCMHYYEYEHLFTPQYCQVITGGYTCSPPTFITLSYYGARVGRIKIGIFSNSSLYLLLSGW